MTPAARVAATIEVLAVIAAAPERAADRVIAEYFRRRRYAGAKDRTDITERVWQVLRRRGELAWRLELLDRDVAPRALVLAWLVVGEGRPPAEIATLCDGSGFAPAPLDAAEHSLLDALARPPETPPPDWVRGNYPAWLHPALSARFGDALLAEMQALSGRAPADFRVNRLKAHRENVLARLKVAGIAAEPTKLSPLGVRLAGRIGLTGAAIYRDGWLEPQDEASQLVALLAGAAPGMLAVDLCAGAGGKTLALAAQMRNQGRLLACDSDAGRLRRLPPRAARAGATTVETHVSGGTGDPLLAGLAGQADRVLLDVPCSGTGTWRRQPDARWRLKPEDLARDCAVQAGLLRAGAALVKPGGRLIYATCSLLPAEDEAPVTAFLAERPDFRLLPLPQVWEATVGGDCPVDGPYLLLTPRRHDTDGFFAAILQRQPLAAL